MAYEYFHETTPYSMDPGSDSLYTGSVLPQGVIGASTGVQTANQIQDVANFLNQGMKTVEVSTIQPEVFDMIPKQHLKEINRVTKLTGTDVSLHAPIVEPSGFDQQGGWSEANREAAERQLSNTVIRGHAISPDKPMPVTIHASAVLPGVEKVPIDLIKDLTPEERSAYEKEGAVPIRDIAVNQETGQMQALKREMMYSVDRPEGEVLTPTRRLAMLNNTQWTRQITDLATHKKQADDVLRGVMADQRRIKEIQQQLDTDIPDQQKRELAAEAQALANNIKPSIEKAGLFLHDVELGLTSIYENGAKFGDQNAKNILKNVSEEWKSFSSEQGILGKSQLLDNTLEKIGKIRAPEVFKPIEEFAIDKASETFGNTAWNSYKKHGDKASIISIENPPYGGAMSTAKELKNLIKESRKQFVKKAVSDGMGKSEAKQAAKDMIGATWDTSHISMMRKQGFGKKELIKQAETIAPYVKHVHLNDNFGYSHTDLPPGMGDVPIGKIMEKLKKKGYKGKHIFEGGNFFQHFKTAPHAMVMQAGPSWTQTYGTMGTYSAGYGPFLPQQHFSTYGSGFSGMPMELGGQVQGGQSRMSGTSMT
jgi:hypothetical protein